MSNKNILIGAGMLLIGGATYFGVMKNSNNRYKDFLQKKINTKEITVPIVKDSIDSAIGAIKIEGASKKAYVLASNMIKK